jgi:hypothetical protein
MIGRAAKVTGAGALTVGRSYPCRRGCAPFSSKSSSSSISSWRRCNCKVRAKLDRAAEAELAAVSGRLLVLDDAAGTGAA